MESRIHREVYVRFGGGVFLIEHPSLWIFDPSRWCHHYFCKRNFESYRRWIIAFTKKGGVIYGQHIRQPTKCFTDME